MTRSGVARLSFLAAALLFLTAAGCGPPYQVAEVEGVLLIKGKPAPRVHIQFIPDAARGTRGPISMAETDANGRFTLQLKEGDGSVTKPGAVVGWHRVVLSDLQLAESATGEGVPIRFGQEYMGPTTTPLTQEVKEAGEGKQTVQIQVP